MAGDAVATALTLVDGLAIICEGIAKGYSLFLSTLVEELNGNYTKPSGNKLRRLASIAFNLEDPQQMEEFLRGETREIVVPGGRNLKYDPLQAFALNHWIKNNHVFRVL